MDLHHALRDLHVTRRVGLAAEDADELRASLDDYLSEGDATAGELNLLVDAVRLGAAARMIGLVDAGGDVEAAIRESGMALARDRGSDDMTRACWALAVLGFAAGRVSDQTMWAYPRQRTVPLPSSGAPSRWSGAASTAAGVTMPPPRPPPLSPMPTIWPTPAAVGPVHQPTVLSPPHIGPQHFVTSPAPRGAGRRRALVVLALVLVLVAAAGAAYLVLGSGTDPRPASAERPSPPAGEPVARVRPGTVLDAPDVTVPPTSRTIAMGSATGGVRLIAFGFVDSVSRGDEELAAPEGGRLVAFRLAEWTGCESAPCRSWTRLDLRVEVAGATRALPSGGPTFVVALPAGTDAADLVYRDPVDGFRQTLSLTTGQPTGDNIAVLARPRSERAVRIGRSFRVVDSYAPILPGLTRAELTRNVRVRSAALFFTDDRRPLSDPGRAYLRVDADFNSPVDPVRYRFRDELLTFTGFDGRPYPAIDLDPGEEAQDRDVVFEVPGSLRGGRLTIGGTYVAEAGYSGGVGVTITITVPRRTVRIDFRS